jgi:hypothetical protein
MTTMRLAKSRNGTSVEPRKPRRRQQKRQSISLVKRPERLAERPKLPQIRLPSRMTSCERMMADRAMTRISRPLVQRKARASRSVLSNCQMSSARRRWPELCWRSRQIGRKCWTSGVRNGVVSLNCLCPLTGRYVADHSSPLCPR